MMGPAWNCLRTWEEGVVWLVYGPRVPSTNGPKKVNEYSILLVFKEWEQWGL